MGRAIAIETAIGIAGLVMVDAAVDFLLATESLLIGINTDMRRPSVRFFYNGLIGRDQSEKIYFSLI